MLARKRVKLLNDRCKERAKEDEKIEEYQHLAREVRSKVAQALRTEPLRSEGNMKGPGLLAFARMVTKYWRTGEVKKTQDLISDLCATDCNTLSCVILIYITKGTITKTITVTNIR